MKTSFLSFLKLNRFEFGEQIVTQFVIFECKYLFSIIIFYFHKCETSQDRFHTHAFNALSFKLFGEYTEFILEDERTGAYSTKRRDKCVAYFPQRSYHKIGESNGCATILLSGPWKRYWKEYKDGEIIEYNWNRKQTN